MLRIVALVLLVAGACSPAGRGDDDPGITSDAAVSGPPDVAAARCYASATQVKVMLDIQIEESCAIWNSLADLSGEATISRVGNTITIDFGDGVVFTGVLTNGAVMLTYAHDHTFTDNCGWRASETMRGTMNETDCTFALDYDYVEAVVTNTGSCATACAANADVNLTLNPVVL